MAIQVVLFPDLEAYTPTKEWTVIGETVIFTTFATQVHVRSRLQRLHKGVINVHAEPGWKGQSEINPNDPAPVSSVDELGDQDFRPVAPERFDVFEAVRSGSLLKPCSNVR